MARTLTRLPSVGNAPTAPGDASPRIPPAWVDGLLSATANAAGCRLSRGSLFGYVRVVYDEEGVPVQIGMDPEALPTGCAAVVQAVARTTLADPMDIDAAGKRQWLVLPLTTSHAACTDRIDSEIGLFVPDEGSRPRKVRDAQPDYPADLQRKGVTGTVMISAVISSGGCVAEARVFNKVDERLEIGALQAVNRWLFEWPGRSSRFGLRTLLSVSYGQRVR